MEREGCELKIYQASGPESREGYVPMADRQTFSVFMKNGFDTQCDAELRIDGDIKGTFRLNPHQAIIIERPQNLDAKFRFESNRSRFSPNPPNDGLVQVKFTPQSQPQPTTVSRIVTQSMSPGRTVAGSPSLQRFETAPPIPLDNRRAIQLSLRLVIEDEPINLDINGNYVPPPVG